MKEPLHLYGTQPGEMFKAWPLVSALIEAACKRPGCDMRPVEVFAACLNGEAQLILGLDALRKVVVAAAVTQVREYPEIRSCWVLAVGGEGGHWPAALSAIEAGAARLGCRAVEFVGRRGWSRLLPDYQAAPCEAGHHFMKRLAA